MRPGQIQVFDGLRLTTEHLDHFQGSVHSAIQDIREILGLGRVYAGFEVAASDGETVTVQPGIAFDFQKNRVVSDEPRTVQVTFAPGENTAFVCAKYDQIEEGQVEGRFTLIWDESSLVVRPTVPTQRDNLVALAKVTRAADGSLEVGVPDATADDTTVADSTVQLRTQQGVLRLPYDPAAGAYLGTALAEQLRTALSAGSTAGDRVVVPLASVDLSPGFAVIGLTCYTVLSVTVDATAAAASDENDSTTAMPPRTNVTVRCSATGEATYGAQGVSQFGMSMWPNVTQLTQEGVAHLPLAAAIESAAVELHAAIVNLLTALQLTIRIASVDEASVKILCALECTDASEELVRTLEEHGPRLIWDSQLAWKAVGQSNPITSDYNRS